MFAASIAGAANTLAVCPLELLKCRAQNNRHTNLKYTKEIRKIIRFDGCNGLYRGLSATLYREIVGWAAFFGTYDYLKRQAPLTNDNRLHLAWTMNAGGLSGIACWVLTLPADNIKSL